MSRLETPDPDTLSPEQRKVHEAISSGPRGGVHGPLGVWLWRPELASRAQALGCYCRYDSSLPPRLSELAILITARYWSAEFEWSHHKQPALDAGLDPHIVEAIRQRKTPEFSKDDEKAVYDFSTELQNNRVVSNPTYNKAIELLGQDAVVDLVGILGYYSLISMTINAFEIDAPGSNELRL